MNFVNRIRSRIQITEEVIKDRGGEIPDLQSIPDEDQQIIGLVDDSVDVRKRWEGLPVGPIRSVIEASLDKGYQTLPYPNKLVQSFYTSLKAIRDNDMRESS
jgi:hypothetical protein